MQNKQLKLVFAGVLALCGYASLAGEVAGWHNECVQGLWKVSVPQGATVKVSALGGVRQNGIIPESQVEARVVPEGVRWVVTIPAKLPPGTYAGELVLESADKNVKALTQQLTVALRHESLSEPIAHSVWPADADAWAKALLHQDALELKAKLQKLRQTNFATWHLDNAYKAMQKEPLDEASFVANFEHDVDELSTPAEVNERRIEQFVATWGSECGYVEPVTEIYLVQHPVEKYEGKGRPLYVVLHSSGHNCVNALLCTRSPDNHDIYHAPDDFYALYLDCKMAANTDWWWGYHGKQGTAESACERRCLATIEQVVQQYGIDRNRIYLCGNSMGGSGALGFGLRHGDVFAAVKANVPALVEHACDRMGWNREQDANVVGFEVTSLPEPPLLLSHSAPNDMHWSTGQEHLIAMMKARRYAFIDYWADHKHCNRNSIITAANDLYLTFDWTAIRKDAVLPAFTSAENDTPSPWPNNRDAKGAGQINAFFRWGTATVTKQQVSIPLWVANPNSKHFVNPETIHANVTLRRLGEFTIKAGDTLTWQFGESKGTLTIGTDGLLTIPVPLAITRISQNLVVTRGE